MPPKKRKKVVKAREHYGSDSLDITIPTKIRRELNIEPGDLFEITAKKTQKNEVKIIYRKIYPQE